MRDAHVFGRPAPADEVADAIAGALVTLATVVAEDLVVVDAGDARTVWAVGVAAYAHGWEISATRPGDAVDLRPLPPLT